MKKHAAFEIAEQLYPKFVFRDGAAVDDILSRYPAEQKRSAAMPLIDLAQRQVAVDGAGATPPYGGWIPRAAMDEIARIIEQPPVRVYEVVSFYSMYNLEPVGKYLIQLCTTTPCWLCNAGGILKACEEHLGIHIGDTTADGYFTLVEVECLGACVNAPMVQINDDYYEDLTAETMKTLLDDLRAGRPVTVGSLKGRRGSMPLPGPTTLEAKAKKLKIKV
jgi:NADH dehydrogenase (ubiquinone) flavoprotein 2